MSEPAPDRVPRPRPAAAVLLLSAVLAAGGLARGDEPPAPASHPDALRLLDAARDTLAGYRSVRATVRQRTAASVTADGPYLQANAGRVRFELAGELDGRPFGVTQVSDGEVLFTEYRTGGEPRVTRRDVRQLARTAAESGVDAPDGGRAAFDALGTGGLPALLAAFRRTVTFDAPTTESVGGAGMHVLAGRWNPAARAVLHARYGGDLPEHVPHGVRIYLDRTRLFPHRVRYVRDAAGGDRPSDGVLTLDFTDVAVNVRLPDDAFLYAAPEGVTVEDVTNRYAEELRPKAASDDGVETGDDS